MTEEEARLSHNAASRRWRLRNPTYLTDWRARNHTPRTEPLPQSKLTITDVRLARAMHKEGYKFKVIQRRMSTIVSATALYKAIRGHTYKWVTDATAGSG